MPKRLVTWMRDPPEWRPVWLGGHLWGALMGAVTLTAPPLTIKGELGPVLTTVWGILALVGSLIAAANVYSRHAWAERLGIQIAALGTGLYSATILYLWVSTGENRGTQFFAVSLGLFFFLARFLTVEHWDDRDLAREI
jgi:hypothetical protein